MRLERLRHRSGQLLRARDLRDQLAYQERLRDLHERIPHPAAADAPHIACGGTPGDGTPWRPWMGTRAPSAVARQTPDAVARQTPSAVARQAPSAVARQAASAVAAQVVLGVEVVVDTGAHGFTDVPCYFAWQSLGGRSRVPVVVPYVEEVSATGFVFRLVMRGLPDTGPDAFVAIALAERWSVCWIAVSRPADLLEGE
ncbi:hypothetical protein ABGB18_28280 [Nonomuraea sp. B12E4]|uniref:hypothetical protein n=1 Tax=Nonomuraea sp. B12E4 TaxID=3153564 RepID=UPI00325DAABE